MTLKTYQIKILDSTNQAMLNFPMATRYVGSTTAPKNNKLTSQDGGILTFQSDGKSVEIFVLAPINSDGSPNLQKFKEDNDNDNIYYRLAVVDCSRRVPSQLSSPYKLSDYGVANTIFTFFENKENQKKYTLPLYVNIKYLKGEGKQSTTFIETKIEVKNSTLKINSILHSRIIISPMMPDNTFFKDKNGRDIKLGYAPRKTELVDIPIYLSAMSSNGNTEPNQPNLPDSVTIQDELINVSEFVKAFKKDCHNLTMAEGTKCPSSVFNAQSESNLKEVCQNINNFFKSHKKYHPNLYEIAYMLATGFIESYHYLKPQQLYSRIPEGGGKAYFNKYDIEFKPKKAKELGNLQRGDGYTFRGRGLVQLTGRSNYKKFSSITGKNLEENPDLACEFQYSVPIMIVGMKDGIFTGYKLSSFINNDKIDYLRARRIINGKDKAAIFSNNAKIIEALLQKTSPKIPLTF
ncbi:hypothetical protein [Acinetobacter seifertii]|uniref:hypothetical protein n=1 Tax=Acinetobacter seifertii TaxID=1530123 RepID=UPI000C1E6122|nr:hypothetical protein [Acinetobacter seifertii]PJF03496.1 hypothetical protein CVD06_11885 [Acinetobacter seifertii]PJG69895.1 hypothetical protein CVD08_12530 [Acinetobacter seifertii]